MKITEKNDLINVEVPYNKEHIKSLKRIGSGYWDPTAKVWIFPLEKRQDLELMREGVVKIEDYSRETTLLRNTEKLS